MIKKTKKRVTKTKTEISKKKVIKNLDDKFLVIENLYKSFGKAEVLKEVNLIVKKNKITGIIGVSGGGKTTLLNILVGFLNPDEGSIKINKRLLKNSKFKSDDFIETKKMSKRIKYNFGFSSQVASVYPELTVVENLKYFAQIQKIDSKTIKENVDSLLKFTQLEKHQTLLAKELSGGMLKRLDIACAIIHNPKILILDEPTANLDPLSRANIWDLIKKINSNGTSIIIASHFIDELDILCDNVAVLHKGTIVKQESPTQLKEIYGKSDVIRVETISADYKQLTKSLSSKFKDIKTNVEFGKLLIYSKKPNYVLNEIIKIITRNNDHLLSLDLNKPSLKEIFENLEKD